MRPDLLAPPKTKPRKFDLGECEPILALCPDLSPLPVGIIPGSCPAVIDLADVTEAGNYCWHCSGSSDYPAATIDGQKIRLHRFICQEDAETIDHRSGDQADNRSCNLRPATYSQNRQNVPGSVTRAEILADLRDDCSECALPCLEYPDDELDLVVVSDANYPGSERASDYLLDGLGEYLGPATPESLAETTEGADAVLVLAPTWTHDRTASGLLDRLGPWLDIAAELDPCVALMRPGPTFDHLARPHVADGLESLTIALRCGCEEGALCYVDDCEEVDLAV